MEKHMETYRRWLAWEKLPEADRELLREMESNPGEIYESFYRDLAFGTAGLRGIMGPGTNRMNPWVIGRVTQGIARYLLEGGDSPLVVIGYDSRNRSREFAERTASVLAANGIHVRMFSRLTPVPAVSFMVPRLGARMGIMITASHNLKIYNGYKVYGRDGGQILAEEADRILAAVDGVDLFNDVPELAFQEALAQGLCGYLGEDDEAAYMDAVMALSTGQSLEGLKAVYTPLNGAGNLFVREALRRAGLTDLAVVPEQEQPDGNFPTCPNPNPELPEAYDLARPLARATGADLIIATDPDSDRLGAAVPAEDGDGGMDGYRVLSGNEIAVLLLDYLLKVRPLPENPLIIRTIVSTPLVDAMAERRGMDVKKTLIGFKYIGEQLTRLAAEGQEDRFVLGFEEGNGFLASSYLRDKDGVGTALLLCQAAAFAKEQGGTLLGNLKALHRQYGTYREKVLYYLFEGARGTETMTAIVEYFRENQREEFLGDKPTRATDYLEGSIQYLGSSKSCSMAVGMRPTNLPPENIMEFHYENQTIFIIRPSGTEPKLKLYLFARSRDPVEAEANLTEMENKLRVLIASLQE